MNCIIIEDQPPAQRILKKYISDFGLLDLVGTFTDAIQGLEYLKDHPVDLIFLDIHLPKLSGIDFLKTLDKPPFVIFTTAFPDFALDGYELNVVDYLLKPFSFPRFVKAVSKVSVRQMNETSNRKVIPPIFIKSGHDYHKVEINEILFIHSDRDYTEIQTSDVKYLSKESLKYWEDYLDEYNFIRIHKSYLISGEKIIKVTSSIVELVNNYNIPIGRAYKDNVNSILKK